MKPETAERVLERLGFGAPPLRTRAGLDAVYRAWCRSVPFDNVRKRIALLEEDPAPMPGGHAADFHAHWLAHGTGGTCWPSSNGLFTLLDFCGFDARRISASMQDMGEPNHGSVAVHLDGQDWMADTSMQTDAIFPIRRGEAAAVEHALHPVSLEPVDGTLRIHWAVPMGDSTIPCRLLEDPVGHSFYLERYEITRAPDKSPFNQALYARKNFDGAVLAYLGRTRFWKRPGGVESAELEPDALARSLCDDLGLSEEIVDRLGRCGGL
ncbi:MAG: arylamine N-acetyltransferase [Deltaproteobacteria bacterium]|nr:arylamine N-acetyltransferase [Deltaproteobacteria bacterium]